MGLSPELFGSCLPGYDFGVDLQPPESVIQPRTSGGGF